MTLSISNGTYARSTSGIKTLKANLTSDIDSVLKNLRGAKYTALVNTIKSYWVGQDATAYLNNLDNQVKALEDSIVKFKSCVDAFDTEQKDFLKFQANNK